MYTMGIYMFIEHEPGPDLELEGKMSPQAQDRDGCGDHPSNFGRIRGLQHLGYPFGRT